MHAPEPLPLGRRIEWRIAWSPLVLGGATLALFLWTRDRWAEPLVDFGRELYIAWQLHEGQSLYTDLAYYNGPLSPHVNALAFAVSGVSIRSLVWANLAVLVAILALLHRLLLRLSSRSAACVACVVFLFVFAFGHLVGLGTYNYLCPYSHEFTHGFLLALIAVSAEEAFARSRLPRWRITAALAVGLALLTRAELFAPIILGWATMACLRPTSPEAAEPRLILPTVVAGLTPPVVAWALLSIKLGATTAAAGILAPWRTAANPALASMHFFQRSMGLDDVSASLSAMLVWLGGYAIVAVLLLLIAKRAAQLRGFPASAGPVMGLLLCIGGLWSWLGAPPFDAARPLPVLLLLMIGFLLGRFRRAKTNEEAAHRLRLAIGLAVMGLALLVKMALHCRFHHYGFVLAVPATMLLIIAAIDWIPRHLDHRGASGSLFRWGAIGLISAATLAFAGRSAHFYESKVHLVGHGCDSFLADDRAQALNAAHDEIVSRCPPEQTLCAMPEGVMLNYLTRRRTSIPFTNFMPTEFVIYGEQAILDSLALHPPDWVALVHKDTSEFGYRFFGADYGRQIGRWLQENYAPAGVIGNPPLRDERFGLMLLRRRPPQSEISR